MTFLKSKAEIEAERVAQLHSREVQIDLSKPPVLYARQSAKEQNVKNKQAKAMQTDDLLDLAEEYGWNRDVCLLFVENYYNQYGEYDPTGKVRNASGKLQIDNRPGLQHVVHLIENDKVSAVICRDISRLFRQDFMVGPTVFTEACYKHHTIIVTPSHLYDFCAVGRGDLDRFWSEAKTAAAYLKNLSEVVHAARHRKGTKGLYSGHSVPCGFMLNDAREGYIPNPVWSPVVADITHRFRQLDGDIALLRRELIGKMLFPDLPADIASRVGRTNLEKVQDGYTIKSRGGLVYILTNVANIGHVAFDGQIVRRDAHEPIVNLDDFDFAIKHLAGTDIDGNPILRDERAVRIPHKSTISRDGLLSGVRANGRPVLTSDQGSCLLFQTAERSHATYAIRDMKALSLTNYVGGISVEMLDSIFEARLLERLDNLSHLVQAKQWREGQAPVDEYETEALAQVAADFSRWHAEREDNAEQMLNHFDAIRQEVQRGVAGVAKSIAETKRQINTLKTDLERDCLQPFMASEDREDCYAALKNLRANLAALERKQAAADAIMSQIEANGKRLVMASKQWPDMSLEKRKMFVRIATQSIQLHDSGCGFMEMIVNWHPLMGYPSQERCHIMCQNGASTHWSAEEVHLLKQHYPQSEKGYIIRLLPKRSWRSIITKASEMGIVRQVRSFDSNVPILLSLETHEYMQEHNLCDMALGESVWRRVLSIIQESVV